MTKSFVEIFDRGQWEGQQIFTDGTLQTDDGTLFQIHRVVLSQRSGYFRAFFSYKLNQETVVIHNMESKILESILLYIYTGTINVDDKNVRSLILASDYFLLDDLLQTCRSFAIQNLATNNCLPSLTLACQIEKLAMTEECYRYTLVHFEDIVETSNAGWGTLPFEVFQNLLKSNSLNVSSERSVWKAIVMWTEASLLTRLSHVPSLLTYLRLEKGDNDEEEDRAMREGAGDIEELAAEILSHPIITGNTHCSDLVWFERICYYMTKGAILSRYARSEVRDHNNPPSTLPRAPNHLYIIARHTLTSEKYLSELFLTYDGELDFWRLIAETDFFIDTILQIGHFIYLISVKENLNLIFDIIEKVFLPVGLSPWPCDNCCIITVKEQIFSIGGTRRQRDFRDMAYRYEFGRNRWTSTPMTQHVVIYGAVALNNLIYIVGKRVGNGFQPEPVLFCQTYDPETSEKVSIASPDIYRRGFSLATFKGKMYLVAGENEGQYLKSVEAYNPSEGTWMSLPDLPFQYFFPKAVVVDGKLIVFENNEDTRCFKVAPPVFWVEDVQCWRVMDESSPLFCMERYSFLVLDDRQIVKTITAGNRGPGSDWQRIRRI